MVTQSTQKIGCLPTVVIGFFVLAIIGAIMGRDRKPGETVSAPLADIQWEQGTSSDGYPQRWASMSFERCIASKSAALANLNVNPRRLIEIVNTGVLTMTRVCLDDGTSMLITCSKPDAKMLLTVSPHTTDVGCPS